jgi:ATP adenylyltransferase
VTRADESSGCVFCDAQSSPDAQSMIVHQGLTCFAILNLYPYNSGHLLIVSRRHVATLAALAIEELNELALITQHAERALNEAYSPQGLNVGLNLGRPAGAGIADHLHVHVVPRWAGDTNFMSVVGQVRVLPEELPQTAERLRPIFARLAGSSS